MVNLVNTLLASRPLTISHSEICYYIPLSNTKYMFQTNSPTYAFNILLLLYPPASLTLPRPWRVETSTAQLQPKHNLIPIVDINATTVSNIYTIQLPYIQSTSPQLLQIRKPHRPLPHIMINIPPLKKRLPNQPSSPKRIRPMHTRRTVIAILSKR